MAATTFEAASGTFEIPTIDISPYRLHPSSQAAQEVVQKVKQACTTVGFLQIVGHGVPRKLQDAALEGQAAFFALPLEEKRKLDRTLPGSCGKGYEVMGTQEQKRGLGGDTKEVCQENDPIQMAAKWL